MLMVGPPRAQAGPVRARARRRPEHDAAAAAGGGRAPGGYAFAAAARTGGGVTRAATMTIVNASPWSTMPRVSVGIGSPKTTIPPRMQETLAAVDVAAMTGTASPSCMPRAEA